MAFPTAVNSQITDAVSQSNVTVIGSGPGLYANLAYGNAVNVSNLAQQNAVANQQAMNELGVAVVAKAIAMFGS